MHAELFRLRIPEETGSKSFTWPSHCGRCESKAGSEQSTACKGWYITVYKHSKKVLQLLYLKDTLSISSYSCMQGSPSHVVPCISICTSIQQTFCSICSGVTGCQVQRHLPSAVRLGLQVGALIDQVCYYICWGVFCVLVILANIGTAHTQRCQHERSTSICGQKRGDHVNLTVTAEEGNPLPMHCLTVTTDSWSPSEHFSTSLFS